MISALSHMINAILLLRCTDKAPTLPWAWTARSKTKPLTISLSHKLAKRLTDVRRSGLLPYLRPDGKTQVTVEYDGRTPKRVDTVVVSAQHDEYVTQEQLKKDILKPEGDSGLTGRKIIVDTYGGRCAHGGGAFSGKDPTKVDRSAAYMARYICKNLVEAGLADEVQIQLAYAIGVSRPVSVFIDTYGTGKLPDGEIADIVIKEFDLRPYSIINNLKLRAPIYANTSAYGHFGKSGLPWEKTDKAESLKKYL